MSKGIKVPALMGAAHSRKTRVSKSRPVKVVGASGIVVAGTTDNALAVACAAMAADETRRYGRMLRSAAKRSGVSQRRADKALELLERLQASEPSYAVAGQSATYAEKLNRAANVALALLTLAESHTLTANAVKAAHSTWSAYVVMPNELDREAHASATAIAWQATVIRRRTRVVSVSSGRVELAVSGDVSALGGLTPDAAIAASYVASRNDRDRSARGIAARIEVATMPADSVDYVARCAYADGRPITPRLAATLRAFGIGVAEVATSTPRVELTWDSDSTRDALDALRRELLKSSPLAARRMTSPSPHDPATAQASAVARKTRRANRHATMALNALSARERNSS